MNTSNPPSAHQNDRFPLPEFLGVSPDEGPERLPKPPWDTICEVVGRIADHCPGHEPTPSHSQLRRFFQRFLTLDQSSFAEGITAFFDTEHKWPRLPSPCWEDLLFYLDPDPDRVPKKKENPYFSPIDSAHIGQALSTALGSLEKYHTQLDQPGVERPPKQVPKPKPPLRSYPQMSEADRWELEEARAERLAREIPQAKAAAAKHLQPPSKNFLLLKDNILKRAPSPNKTLELFLFVHAHTFNKDSKPGRHVYRYGQVYACKGIGLPTRKKQNGDSRPGSQFDQLWAWLVKKGLFNKRSNENPEAHRCATWYVCTSLEQVGHFRDPHHIPRKKAR